MNSEIENASVVHYIHERHSHIYKTAAWTVADVQIASVLVIVKVYSILHVLWTLASLLLDTVSDILCPTMHTIQC